MKIVSPQFATVPVMHKSSDHIEGSIVLISRRAIIVLLERNIGYLIFLPLCGFEKAYKRTRWRTPVSSFRTSAGLVHWTRRVTISFPRTTLWFRIVGGFFTILAFPIRFPPWSQRTFPWLLPLFLFLRSCFPWFLWVHWWTLQFCFLSMLSCFLQELVKTKKTIT